MKMMEPQADIARPATYFVAVEYTMPGGFSPTDHANDPAVILDLDY